jgi:hypothetical protein
MMRGQRGCRGWSWKGCRGAPRRGGAQGGDGRAEWWTEEVELGGPGSGSRRQHSGRRKQRQGMSGRRMLKRGSS